MTKLVGTRTSEDQSDRIPCELRRVFARNATQEQFQQIRANHVGMTTFQQNHLTYRVTDVLLDDLKRVIFVGQLASM